METQKACKGHLMFVPLILFGLIAQCGLSLPVIGLVNRYNCEASAKTGKPFHYLWTDTEFRGHSRWREMFSGRGVKLTTLGKPDPFLLTTYILKLRS